MQGLQPNFKLVGDFLEICFVWYFSTAPHSRWLFDRRPLARSADDVVRALDAGGKEQAARMSHQKVAHYALTASTVRTVSEQRSLGGAIEAGHQLEVDRSWP